MNDPEKIVMRELYNEMQRIKNQVANSEWFLFGSVTTAKRPIADLDFLVVCKTTADCVTVRAELTSVCTRFPLHLLLMTQSEEVEVKFIQSQRAIEFSSALSKV